MRLRTGRTATALVAGFACVLAVAPDAPPDTAPRVPRTTATVEASPTTSASRDIRAHESGNPGGRPAGDGPGGRAGPAGPTPPPDPQPGDGVAAPGARYAWPLHPPPAVLTPFRAPAHAYAPGHRGVDLAGAGGQAVLAARGGTVVFAGPVAGRGVVSVDHDDGLRTTYEPVRPTVRSGAVVRAGDVLGLLAPGHTGCPQATCLHWGLRRNRVEYLDPLVLLRPPRVRLLPVPDPWPLPG